MDGSHDSITRARALERAGELRAALGAYRGALAANEVADTGALRVRVGELHAHAGEGAEASESFARAAELFTASGQANNAIVAWQRVLEIDPDDPEALDRLSALALEKSYRVLARDLTTKRVADAIAAGAHDRAFEVLTGYLGRIPDDQSIWRGWFEQLRVSGPTGVVVEELRRLAAFLRDAGSEEAALSVEAEARSLDPPLRGTETEEAARPLDRERPPEEGKSADIEGDLPLLGLLPDSDMGDEAPQAHPLRGLEPTHAEEVEETPAQALEGLNSGVGDDAPAGADAAPSDAAPSGPLPFLDGLPGDAVRGPEAGNVDVDAPVRAAVHELERISGARSVKPADPAVHYDLGIAYNAMGLREEAAAQFAAALAGGHYPAAVAEAAGEALLTSGDPDGAVRVLTSILRLGGGEDESAFVGVSYWLGRAYEMLGALANADAAYRRAAAIDADFHDLAERLERSGGHSF